GGLRARGARREGPPRPPSSGRAPGGTVGAARRRGPAPDLGRRGGEEAHDWSRREGPHRARPREGRAHVQPPPLGREGVARPRGGGWPAEGDRALGGARGPLAAPP